MNDRDLSALLKTEFNRRMTNNHRYSLRAFARSIKMDPSTLSKILTGQRKVGPRAQANILTRLGIPIEEYAEFFSQICDEKMALIPEWYDTAILEQLNVTGFRATAKSLAQ
ncbi:MAG: helix-turn-helix domain-containing protein, partial [Pseudobdellovibrionaceae bacterium]